MLAIAVIGFFVNTTAALLLKTHAHRDLNLKSAYLHLFTDAIESLAVVLVAGIIMWKNWQLLDPIISIGIGLFIIKSAWSIVAETVHILTEGTPRGIDLHEVADYIRSVPGVEHVHHLHIWGLSSHMRALSVHIVVKDQLISDANKICLQIEEELEHRFGINHPTLHVECDACPGQGTIANIEHIR